MIKLNDYYNPDKGTEISSINIDPNLIFAVFIFISVITIIIIYTRSRTSRLDKKIINQQPIWHEIEKENIDNNDDKKEQED